MNKPFFTRAEMPEAIGHDRSEQPLSAVRLPISLTAEIDAWANHEEISRSEAIRRLVELGLNAIRIS
jgi:Ribbon-helix-helix protein, copG family